jgi:A/G-specific adenine glycosylase
MECGVPYLPFGRTSVSDDELRDMINTASAVNITSELGVRNPGGRISALIDCLPNLLLWLEENGRRYPWRETTDPWRIYLTEILLQRTRADAVEKIYDEFFDRFPDPQALYGASDTEIRETVHSLGLVNHRTRTLREISNLCVNHGGVPHSMDKLKQPWRVGEYSARACQLFARGEPLALVDTNFARVFGRVLGNKMPEQPHKSVVVYSLLDALTPDEPAVARAFNLAILDLGAKICTPSSPRCRICPLSAGCRSCRT